jgi:DNA-directed RNA polymerase specialized sigma24 family protein
VSENPGTDQYTFRMTSESAKRDYFLQLLSSCENRLRAFILGALATAEDRADVFQDIVLILWRKFEHYDNSRPFLPWAMGIAVLRMKEVPRVHARLLANFSGSPDGRTPVEKNSRKEVKFQGELRLTCLIP